MGERHRESGATAVFVSDLHGAVQTAEIAFGASGLAIYKDARLRECNYGDLNGIATTLLAAERSKHIDVPFPAARATARLSTECARSRPTSPAITTATA
jgi:broad specificity phosphatase PhoE